MLRTRAGSRIPGLAGSRVGEGNHTQGTMGLYTGDHTNKTEKDRSLDQRLFIYNCGRGDQFR